MPSGQITSPFSIALDEDSMRSSAEMLKKFQHIALFNSKLKV
jgi:hypothetical protein